MSAAPIQPVFLANAAERLLSSHVVPTTQAPAGASFSQILLAGINLVDRKIAAADAQVRAFAIDDSIPVHQVMFALERARLSLEFMMQVRSRLVEGYQQIMNMQL
jgi:flagellar hook-basal body complex protein FliE